MFVKYVFYFTREVKNMYFLFRASPLMKYKIFSTSLDDIKAIFNNKNLISFMYRNWVDIDFAMYMIRKQMR